MFKKIMSVSLISILCFMLAGCGSKNMASDSTPSAQGEDTNEAVEIVEKDLPYKDCVTLADTEGVELGVKYEPDEASITAVAENNARTPAPDAKIESLDDYVTLTYEGRINGESFIGGDGSYTGILRNWQMESWMLEGLIGAKVNDAVILEPEEDESNDAAEIPSKENVKSTSETSDSEATAEQAETVSDEPAENNDESSNDKVVYRVTVDMIYDQGETTDEMLKAARQELIDSFESGKYSYLGDAAWYTYLNACEFSAIPRSIYSKYEEKYDAMCISSIEDAKTIDDYLEATGLLRSDYEDARTEFCYTNAKSEIVLAPTVEKLGFTTDSDKYKTTMESFASKIGKTAEELAETYGEEMLQNTVYYYMVQEYLVDHGTYSEASTQEETQETDVETTEIIPIIEDETENVAAPESESFSENEAVPEQFPEEFSVQP